MILLRLRQLLLLIAPNSRLWYRPLLIAPNTRLWYRPLLIASNSRLWYRPLLIAPNSRLWYRPLDFPFALQGRDNGLGHSGRSGNYRIRADRNVQQPRPVAGADGHSLV